MKPKPKPKPKPNPKPKPKPKLKPNPTVQEVLPGLSPAAAPTMLGVLGAPLSACTPHAPGTRLAYTCHRPGTDPAHTWHTPGTHLTHRPGTWSLQPHAMGPCLQPLARDPVTTCGHV